MRLRLFLFVMLVLNHQILVAQCTTPIAAFPYNEGFETSNGNWTRGGNANDWAWGTPSKTVIRNAACGTKCFITGGLTGNRYNNGEYAFIESPCFNFSSLTHPRLSLKVFWETERKYDGANIKYSTDGGNTWTLLGNENSNSSCRGQNWYNNAQINYLNSGEHGWTGNIQNSSGSCHGGSGSGMWMNAWHELESLAGKPQVKFRIYFGAGTTCNAFNGFAVDDIQIAEAPPSAGTFSYNCKPNRTINFTANAACATGYAWNFGDPGSTNNTATQPSADHTFSAPGTYTVTLVTTYASGPATTTTQTVQVADLQVNISQPNICSGDATATLSASLPGVNAAISYSWNTTPVQSTAVINNVAPGNYEVQATFAGGCANAASVIVPPSPAAIKINGVVTDENCSAKNGSITTSIDGGTTPYQYLWSNNNTSSQLTGVSSGSYTLNITDAKGCMASKDFNVGKKIGLSIFLGNDTTICGGAALVLAPGSFADYQWQDGSTLPTYTVTSAGTYSVEVTTADGCTGKDEIKVSSGCSEIIFPNAFTPNNDGKNDYFGPVGSGFGTVTKYQLKIFNRYGELVFSSNDPIKKWDGKIKGEKVNAQAFVWMAEYIYGGEKRTQKGSVLLVR